jgi:hypothetical protein
MTTVLDATRSSSAKQSTPSPLKPKPLHSSGVIRSSSGMIRRQKKCGRLPERNETVLACWTQRVTSETTISRSKVDRSDKSRTNSKLWLEHPVRTVLIRTRGLKLRLEESSESAPFSAADEYNHHAPQRPSRHSSFSSHAWASLWAGFSHFKPRTELLASAQITHGAILLSAGNASAPTAY